MEFICDLFLLMLWVRGTHPGATRHPSQEGWENDRFRGQSAPVEFSLLNLKKQAVPQGEPCGTACFSLFSFRQLD
jgi:hypothetical protein